MDSTTLRQGFLLTTLAALAVSAAIGIAAFIIGEFGDTQVKLLVTTLAVGGFSLTGMASTRAAGQFALPLSSLGIAASIVGLALALLTLWEVVGESEGVFKAIAILVVLAFSSAHLSLLTAHQPSSYTARMWKAGATAAAFALAALLIAGIVDLLDSEFRDRYLRVLGVAAILDVLGTVALLPLARLAVIGRGRSERPGKPAPRPGKGRGRK